MRILRGRIHKENENFEDLPSVIKLHCYLLEVFNVIPLFATSQTGDLQIWDGTSFFELMVVQLNEFISSKYCNLVPQEVTDSFLLTFNRLANSNRTKNGGFRSRITILLSYIHYTLTLD